MAEYINKRALIEEVRKASPYEDDISKSTLIHGIVGSVDHVDISKFTDAEQRIFLSAMAKEMAVCKKVNKQPGEIDLVAICNSIEKKVKNALF